MTPGFRTILLTAALSGSVASVASSADDWPQLWREPKSHEQLSPAKQLVARGQLRLARGQYAAARADFDRAWRAGDHSPEVHHLLIRCLVGERKLSIAADEADRLLDLHPEMSSVHVTLAHIAFLSEDYATAVEEASTAIAQRANLADACFIRAYAQARMGNFEEALSDVRRAAAEARDKSDFRAEAPHLLQGAVLRQLGQHQDALLAYDRALRLNEQSTNALLGQWTCYQQMQMIPAAFLVAKEMLEMNPEATETLRANAVSHRQFEEYAVAVEYATRWREASFSDPRPCVEQSRSLMAMRRWLPAREALEEALVRDDQNVPAMVDLSGLLVSCPDKSVRDASVAQELAEQACELTDWKSPAVIATLAATHAAQGEQARAASLMNRCLALLSGDDASREAYVALQSQYVAAQPAKIAEGDDTNRPTVR